MIIIKAKILHLELEQETFLVESRSSLIFLLQALEKEERCKSYVIFDSVQFEQIKDLKQRFNISNLTMTKLNL